MQKSVGKILRRFRKRRGLYIKDVAEKLQEESVDIAIKTIYGWESGQSFPRVDVFLRLCRMYGIADILGTFGYCEPNDLILTDYEKQLITEYRRQPEMQYAISRLLGVTVMPDHPDADEQA